MDGGKPQEKLDEKGQEEGNQELNENKQEENNQNGEVDNQNKENTPGGNENNENSQQNVPIVPPLASENNVSSNYDEPNFTPPSSEEARKEFTKWCLSIQEGSQDDIAWLANADNNRGAARWLGEDKYDYEVRLIDGVAWAVGEAVRLGFKGIGISANENKSERQFFMFGVVKGFARLLAGKVSLSNESFYVQSNFPLGEAGLDNSFFNKVLDDDSSPYEIEVDKEGKIITLRMKSSQPARRDEMVQSCRDRLLQKFRTQEIAYVDYSDYKLAGVAWAVKVAMTDSQSKVKELVFESIKTADDDYNQIGVGIGEALREGWSANNVFSIRVGFDVDIYNHLDGLEKSAGSGNGIVILLGTRRIFVSGYGEAEKWLITSLNNRFANLGDSYVYEFELDLYDCLTEHIGVKVSTGLAKVLYLAAKPESNVKALYLRTSNGNEPFLIKGRREGELKDALKTICAWLDINKSLKIRTNLTGNDAEDFEFDVNCSLDKEACQILVNGDGEIRIGSVGMMNLLKAKDCFKNKDVQDRLKAWFGNHTEVSWKGLLKEAEEKKYPVPFASSYVGPFRTHGRWLSSKLIPLAAAPESKVDMLTLDGAASSAVVKCIKEVLKSDAIHEFKLVVPNAQTVFASVQNDSGKAAWKHELKINGDTLEIVAGGSSATPTSSTSTSGSSTTAPAGEIAVNESRLKELEKEFENNEPVFFESLGGVSALSQRGLPVIYAYDFFNDREDPVKSKKMSDEDVIKQDLVLITGAAEPQKLGLKKDDLVLNAICFYKKGLYADSTCVDKKGNKQETRNYFTHTWLKECAKPMAKDQGVFVKTSIVRPNGIRGISTFDCFASVVIHKEGNFLSPRNCIFEIAKNNASAWFISEFDPTDDAYNPKTGSARRAELDNNSNSDYVEFPGVTGKRTIAIHWTFIEDDNNSSAFNKARADAEANGKYKFPWQFSDDANKRSMNDVYKYLKEKEEKEKEEKEKELLKKLEDATRSHDEFDLSEASARGMLTQVLEKANELDNAKLSLLNLPDAVSYEGSFKALKGEIEGLIVNKKFRSESQLSILAKLSNPEIKLKAYEFQDDMNKVFVDNSLGVFVNLDKDGNRIFFSDKPIKEKEEKLPELQINSSGKLIWTSELKCWWRNSTNEAKTFALALAELPGLNEVNFGEVAYSEGTDFTLVDPDEWKKFADNEVLHRYREKKNLHPFSYYCSKVKFTFIPEEKGKNEFKQTLDSVGNFQKDIDTIDVNALSWSLSAGIVGCNAVEDGSGRNRLVWCSAAREYLRNIADSGDEVSRKQAAEDFANEVWDASTLDRKDVNCIDFTVVKDMSGLDCVRKACECKELWEALKDKFGAQDDFVIICSGSPLRTKLGDGTMLGKFLQNQGWGVRRLEGDVYEIRIDKSFVPGSGVASPEPWF